MHLANLLNGSVGLDTKIDPLRLQYNPETGVGALALATNITIDNTGGISRRLGWNLAVSGELHSVWCDGGDCFCILETASYASLMQVGTDLSLTGLRSGLTKNLPMSFVDVNGDTYYSNGIENGYVSKGVSNSWPTGSYAGPDTTRDFITTPVGKHLGFHAGRILVAVDNVMWETEPFSPGMVDPVRGFWQFSKPLQMIKGVQNHNPFRPGVFVSDERSVYFLDGTSVNNYRQTKVATNPAYPGGCATDLIEVDDLDFGEEGLGVLWVAKDGLYIGLPSGRAKNLTKEKLTYPKAFSRGACLICGYHVINTTY